MNNFDYHQVHLVKATASEQVIVQNLFQYYIYEIAGVMGHEKGWEIENTGKYELIPSLPLYWQEELRFPYLVRVSHELAGFALVNKLGVTPQTDWNMGEFFILKKFQHKGIGQYVAQNCFNMFQGTWDVMVMPGNTPAYEFWRKVITQYTNRQFEESTKIIPYKNNVERNIFSFTSGTIKR